MTSEKEKPRYRLLSDEEMDERASAAMKEGFEWLREQRRLGNVPPLPPKPDG